MHTHVNVYLRTSPSIIMENLYKREQTGDEKITLEDLIDLHEKHEDYVKTLNNVIIIEVENIDNFRPKNPVFIFTKGAFKNYVDKIWDFLPPPLVDSFTKEDL